MMSARIAGLNMLRFILGIIIGIFFAAVVLSLLVPCWLLVVMAWKLFC